MSRLTAASTVPPWGTQQASPSAPPPGARGGEEPGEPSAPQNYHRLVHGDRPLAHEPDRLPPTATAVAKGLVWYVVAHGARQSTALGSLIVLGALLAPEAFGTLAAALAVMGIPVLLLGAGTRGALITSKSLSAGQIHRAVTFVLAAGIAFAVLIAAAAEPLLTALAKGGDPWVLRVLALALPIQALTVVPISLLERRLEFNRLAKMVSASTIIAALVAVVAAAVGAGVWALVLRYLLVQVALAIFCWRVVGPSLPPGTRRARVKGLSRFRLEKGTLFLVLAVADFIAFGADNLVVGRFTDATRLGLYALAFQLAWAPLTQISWQIGGVLFPSTAAMDELEVVGRRTLKATRLLALVLLPLVAPAFVLAGPVLPALFGQEWQDMVTPFRILLVVGAAHGVLNVIGESLSGTGNIGFRARVHLAWALVMVVCMFPLVKAAGITGAALAHLLMFFPFAAAYALVGTRLIGTNVRRLALALKGVVLPVCIQALVTAAASAVLSGSGLADLPSAIAASVCGGLVLAALLLAEPSKPLREAAVLIRGALSRSPS